MATSDEGMTAPVWDGGAPETLAEMIRGTGATKIEAGASLARQGEQSAAAFALVEGTVRVVARIFSEVVGFAQESEQADDITCLALIRPSPPAAG